MDVIAEVRELCESAKRASHSISLASEDKKNKLLLTIAELLIKNSDSIIEANKIDLAKAEENGVAKAMLQVNYMEQGEAENKAVVLSATAPVAGGKLLAMAGYGVATDADGVDTDKMNFAVGYQYTLSKQTYLYAGLGYNESEVDGGAKTDATIGQFGICHSF